MIYLSEGNRAGTPRLTEGASRRIRAATEGGCLRREKIVSYATQLLSMGGLASLPRPGSDAGPADFGIENNAARHR